MPHTIAENLQRLVSAKNNIAAAITAKGGTVGVSDGLEEFSADIATIPSGGGSGPEEKVVFIDYDGTVLHEYTKAAFAALDSLPANPTHTGLTSLGWNWTLSDAKTHMQNLGGVLTIGQLYTTDDGTTRLYISVGSVNPGPETTINLYLKNTTVEVDWGDSTTSEMSTTSTSYTQVYTSHAYQQAGEYLIVLRQTTGTEPIRIGQNRSNNSSATSNIFKGQTNTNLLKAEIGSNVLLGNAAFYSCNSLQTIVFCQPVGIGYLSKNMFYNCYNLKSVVVSSEVTVLDASCFQNCYSISSIAFPNTITSLEKSCFQTCYSLSSITLPNTVTQLGESCFQNCYSLSSIILHNTITSLGRNCFFYCYSLSSITIPDTITSLGDNCFAYCYSLSSITLPNTITSLGGNCFGYCYSLSSITLPNTITSLGGSCFAYCSSLSSITLPNTITSLESNCFGYCYSLSSITLPNTITSLGSSCFYNCYSLSSITLPNTVTSLGSECFKYCYSLSSITLPNTVTSLGSECFKYCSSLSSITLPNTVTSLGSGCFTNCTSLSSVYFKSLTPPTATASWLSASSSPVTIIYVPTGTLTDYTSAQYYPNPATYVYLEYNPQTREIVPRNYSEFLSTLPENPTKHNVEDTYNLAINNEEYSKFFNDIDKQEYN